jgi:hypothetical protein
MNVNERESISIRKSPVGCHRRLWEKNASFSHFRLFAFISGRFLSSFSRGYRLK